jgi:archaetidylinositol phosphate synthase
MDVKPWDARAAYFLVQPFKDSWVTPNYFTTLRLMAGLGSGAAFASGLWPNLGACLFVLSNFLDHTDGELARLSGKSSRLGHFYDLTCDAIVHILLFVSIGIGLHALGRGVWTVPLGLIAGFGVAVVFHLRNKIEQRLGKAAVRQPRLLGFELEDVLYLLPLVTLLNGLLPFLITAAIGAPIGAVLVTRQFLRMREWNAPYISKTTPP